MTSSITCSGRRWAALAALLLSSVSCAARQNQGAAGAGEVPLMRLALFPVENLSGAAVPMKQLTTTVEQKLKALGIEVVSGDLLSRFFAAHRIRYTAGLDSDTARAAREDLGVDGVLVASVDSYVTVGSPRFGMTMRLIAADSPPVVRWMDGGSLAGDGSPGLLGRGIIVSMDEVKERVLAKLTASLQAFLVEKTPPPRCALTRRARPNVSYRRAGGEPGRHYSIAVLPFYSQATRKSAGDLLALSFIRQLANSDRFTVVEPGIVRDELLSFRLIMGSGVSLDIARTLLGELKADLVLAGYVRQFEEGLSAAAPPKLSITVLVLERRTERVLWQMTSSHQGDDGVFFYDAGRVDTVNELACRMARAAVDDW